MTAGPYDGTRTFMRRAFLCIITLGFAQFALAGETAWKAGIAREKITPARPLWMNGYGSRTHVSTGTMADIYVRVLALDDGAGKPAVIVGSEILGFPAPVSARIAKEVQKQYNIPRDRLVLNSTHTHSGPAVADPHYMLYGARATPDELRDVEAYARELEGKVIAAIGAAVKDLRPAVVRFGHGKATFAMNRRKIVNQGYAISPNPDGPVDHDVPVLLVESPQGPRIATVFGYACHNTTLGGDRYEFNGDYAGFAQAQLEKDHPNAIALFMIGCGADANPTPRGTPELARQYGQSLAAAVEQASSGRLRPISGPLKSAYQTFPLAFAKAPTREELLAQAKHKDIYFRWQAAELLKELDRDGKLASDYPYPLQVWRFGEDLTFIAMAGEVVVDYVLRLKKEIGGDALWVAGYSNDVFAYIPSRRVLEEGGYEASGAMVYYVQPGPFTPAVEETIIRKAHEMLAGLKLQVR